LRIAVDQAACFRVCLMPTAGILACSSF
jgi:hypothetical protein